MTAYKASIGSNLERLTLCDFVLKRRDGIC